MTRKDYEKIAHVLSLVDDWVDELYDDGADSVYVDGASVMLDRVVDRMSDMLEIDNSNFDRVRFVNACKAPKRQGS